MVLITKVQPSKVSSKGYNIYYKNYVELGKSLNVVIPMATKIGPNSGCHRR